ncbi:LOG family protein [Sphingomonas panacisoli]|uniref:AMP nucleosidase n=1 Tax=Sphingomonas panacisoli TaxID=1813879 RepID=A0A5B8LMU5_9SPHN|nr:LOG family protein [Sphingomonas panacisoli]QDZ08712.1 LOG family protein [Sphingomonas panacisoli]
MTDTRIPSRVFPQAKEEADRAKQGVSTPQTENPAYRLAFQDMDFLLREDLRPVRFQLELLKPELILDEAGIASTFVMYGSARIPEPEKAKALLAAAKDDAARKIAERLVAKSKYYDVARELAQIASRYPVDDEGKRHFVVCSGGGPSIMEAANRGAADVGAESIGLNILLPHEQAPNPYVTPGLSLQFHYFALRKMHFLLHARALAAFPGGFGTFDEFFELLTLIQTGKIQPIPVLLYGREFWERVVNFEALVEEGVVSAKDLSIFTYCETAEEGWRHVEEFYRGRTFDQGKSEAEAHSAEQVAAHAPTARE